QPGVLLARRAEGRGSGRAGPGREGRQERQRQGQSEAARRVSVRGLQRDPLDGAGDSWRADENRSLLHRAHGRVRRVHRRQRSGAANKPDVVVEYNFYQKQAGSEKFFNKTNPTNLNAQTLPPGFDMAAGHQLQAGQAVPLASFPEGDYRLEIKVTDKVANKTLTKEINFTVTPS